MARIRVHETLPTTLGLLLNEYILLVTPSFPKPVNEPGLHHLCQDCITQQHDGQKQPVQRREGDKAERFREGRNRQPGACCDDEY